MREGVYIDLFDDGIPQKNLLIEENDRGTLETRLAHTARFQILLCILFNRPVLVPEAWLISSPTFLRIAQEIEENYSRNLPRKDAIGTRLIPSPPVFQVSFFDDKPGPLRSKYLQAFARRLDENRRIECLNGIIQPRGEASNEQRRHLASFLRNWIPDSNNESIQISRFEPSLTKLLASFGAGEDRALFAAQAISRLLRYLESEPASVSWGCEGESRFRAHMAEQVNRVKNVVSTFGGPLEDHASQLFGFRAFFREVDAKKIELTDVMGMSRLLVNYDPEVAKTISALGRYVLNRGYSFGLQSPYSGVSFNFYAQGSASKFNLDLMSAVLNEERLETPSEFPSFLRLAQGREYDLAERINWPAAWQACAAVAADPKWSEKRDRIADRLMKNEDPTQLDNDAWEDLFDQINGAFIDFKFKYSDGQCKIVSRVKEIIELTKENVNSDSLVVVGGVEEDLASIASVAIPALARLLGSLVGRAIPGIVLVRSERRIQRVRRWFQSNVRLDASSADLLRLKV